VHFVRSYYIGIPQGTFQKTLTQIMFKIHTVAEYILTKCNLEGGKGLFGEPYGYYLQVLGPGPLLNLKYI